MLGTDFEGFIRMDGRYIPAERVLKGGKDSPITLSRGVVGHPDNVMAEAAIAAPVEPKDFAKAVLNARKSLEEYIHPALFVPESSHKFAEEWLADSRYAEEVGCLPDMDTSGNTYKYKASDLGLYRYAGFHIHFDVSPTIDPSYAARVVDCTIGLASIAFGWDHRQGRRRSFYGTAGRHRVKPYGIEYRTLSSKFINNIQEAQPVIEAVADALENENVDILMLPQIMWDAARQAIEEEDTELANALWQQVPISTPSKDK